MIGKGTLGGEQIICMDGHSLTEAHYTVLQNSTLVASYMDEHKNLLRTKHPERSDDWITREQTRSFASWLQARTMHDTSIEDDMYLLSQLPSSNIMTFKGYEINVIHLTQSPKIRRAPTKTVVSALMQQAKGHILWLHSGHMGT